MDERRENRFPWWMGLTVLAALLVICELLSLLYVHLISGAIVPQLAGWLTWGSIFVFDLAAITGFAFLRERVRSNCVVAVACILIGAFAWFIAASEAEGGGIVGPLGRSGYLAQQLVSLQYSHAFTVGLFQFFFFAALFGLLKPPKRNTIDVPQTSNRPVWASTALLLLFLASFFLTTERGPLSLIAAAGWALPYWLVVNRPDIHVFVFDGLTVLCWMGVFASVARRKSAWIPWFACGLALLIVGVLSLTSYSSFPIRRFLLRLQYWFGDPFTASATLLTIAVLSVALRRWIRSPSSQ